MIVLMQNRERRDKWSTKKNTKKPRKPIGPNDADDFYAPKNN